MRHGILVAILALLIINVPILACTKTITSTITETQSQTITQTETTSITPPTTTLTLPPITTIKTAPPVTTRITQTRTITPPTVTIFKTTTLTTQISPLPKGSVLSKHLERSTSVGLIDEASVSFYFATIVANIMNIGEDGTFTVNAKVEDIDIRISSDAPSTPTPSKSTEIYLKKGDILTLEWTFWISEFWGGIYDVWCSP